MKTYSKTHTAKKALAAHASKLRKRGASIILKGKTIKYSFTGKQSKLKLK
ncbi:MAG: hypothetical protein ACOYMA_20510 [Bacteroidia bacterium]